MAKINYVDYEAVPSQVAQMRGYSRELNNEMTNVYTSVEEMHKSWYGDRYNDLVKLFKNMKIDLDNMLQLVVTDIPYALETVANNYSLADKGQKITSASEEPHAKIKDLQIFNDVGMRFITAEVESLRVSISNNFEKARNLMDNYESVYGKIQWQSEASEAFKQKFTTLKGNIVTAFENINTQFIKLMEQTAQDIEKTEQANTVN